MIEFVIMLFVAVAGIVLGRNYQKDITSKGATRREIKRTEAIIEAVEREIVTIDESLKSEEPEKEIAAKWNKLL